MNPVVYTYARALRDCFEKGQEENFFFFLGELRKLGEILNLSDIDSFFVSPAIFIEQKKQILKKVFDSFNLNRLALSFLFLLLEKKRWKELSSILTCLTNMENKMKGTLSVEVESVKLLTPDLKEKLIKKLENFFGKKVSLKEKKVSMKLIGGMRIHTQGIVFDDTLLFHLTQMENQIRRNFHDYTS